MVSKENYCKAEEIGLSEIDLNKIRTVFSVIENIDQVLLYGSRAKGDFKTYSDIDITLKGENLVLDTQFKVVEALDELYLPYTFDVSISSHINNSGLLDHIERVGLVIYQKA
ncbi:nucleotidyltransferase domain-containing protein [Pedobacter alpinus]|uniref:Nucleotidyltransferase domain-containing protein n=1 Tax=Pedobacter alpinus TaxID=1590643 RepID=A0ABW5TXK4_9SPHI